MWGGEDIKINNQWLKKKKKDKITKTISTLLQSEYIFLEQVICPSYVPEVVNYSTATGTAQN